jgi:hypothetical protein
MLSCVFCNHNFTQLKFVLFFPVQNFFLQLDKNIVPFTQKIVTKLPEIRLADPGYEIRYPEKTYPERFICNWKSKQVKHWNYLSLCSKNPPAYVKKSAKICV